MASVTQASTALERVADAYESYSELCTDESRPEVSVACERHTHTPIHFCVPFINDWDTR